MQESGKSPAATRTGTARGFCRPRRGLPRVPGTVTAVGCNFQSSRGPAEELGFFAALAPDSPGACERSRARQEAVGACHFPAHWVGELGCGRRSHRGPGDYHLGRLDPLAQLPDRGRNPHAARRDVESAEAAYIQSIEKLSKLVEPKLEQPASPLMISYREKLMLIDSAIAELRAGIERNRFNAHLRQELLAIYQQKQRTLQEMMREDRNAPQ